VRNRITYLVAALVALTFSVLLPAIAKGQGVALPPGSYQRICGNASYNSATQKLSANCPTSTNPSDPWDKTALIVSYCDPSSDIAAMDGWLQCTAKPGTWGYEGAVPAGSYQKSCDHYQVQTVAQQGPTLSVRCKSVMLAGYAKWGPGILSLNLTGCSHTGDIAMMNGLGSNGITTLTCVPAPANQQSQSGQQQQQQQRAASTQQSQSGQQQQQQRAAPAQQSQSVQQQQQAAPAQSAQAAAPGSCKPGFVWRQADATDHVCVTAQTRQLVANENAMASRLTVSGSNQCVSGYVWRQADKTDFVCVTPAVRASTAADNAAAASHTN